MKSNDKDPSFVESWMKGLYEVEYRGSRVVRILRIPIDIQVTGCVEFISKNRRRPGVGVDIDVDRATLKVKGKVMKGAMCFFERKGDYLPFEVIELGPQAEFQVWNVWEGDGGSTDAWLGNSGMIVSKIPPPESALEAFLCQCSSGTGAPPDFRNLVFRVVLYPLGEGPHA